MPEFRIYLSGLTGIPRLVESLKPLEVELGHHRSTRYTIRTSCEILADLSAFDWCTPMLGLLDVCTPLVDLLM